MATLELATADGIPTQLDASARRLVDGLQDAADRAGIPFTTNQVGGMFGCFFSKENSISRFSQVTQCNMERFQRRWVACLAVSSARKTPSAASARSRSATWSVPPDIPTAWKIYYNPCLTGSRYIHTLSMWRFFLLP
jgi:glutamate-1-semialdehyde 2,1-aminomutase